MPTPTTEQTLLGHLETGLSQFWQRVYKDYLGDLSKQWHSELTRQNQTSTTDTLVSGLKLLSRQLSKSDADLAALRNRYRIFHTQMGQELSEGGRDNLILEFCQYLGRSNAKEDRKALSRWLDENAITERWQTRVKDTEFYANFLMGRLAGLFDILAFSAESPNMLQLWQELKFEQAINPWIRYSYEPKVQLAAFKCISSVLTSLHSDSKHILSSELLRYTYRFSLDNKQQPELQIEALNLLAVADLNKAINLIQTRLNNEAETDQIFFREAIADIICLHYLNKPEIFGLTQHLLNDPSPLVRQSVVRTLTICTDDEQVMALVEQLANDPSDAVFCYLVTQLPSINHSQRSLDFFLAQIGSNQDYLRLRALCFGLLQWAALMPKDAAKRDSLLQTCAPLLDARALSSQCPKTQYLFIETREKLWANSQLHLNSILAPLLGSAANQDIVLDEQQAEAIAGDAGKRWLAANIGHRFSMQLGQKKLIQADVFKFKLWRFLHELFNPATDKRQHHSHVTGRLYTETHLIPSPILAEVSQTTVPGEPYFYAGEGHARPFLPTVDQLLASLRQGVSGREIVLHHISGTTTLTPPANAFAALKARLQLTLKYNHYAKLRHTDYASDKPNRFIQAICALGFKIQCQGHPLPGSGGRHKLTPAVSRFFEIGLPLTFVQFMQDFQRYFVSVYQNTIQHILFFSLFMILLFWGNHAVLSQRVKSARRQIPMTIGGWGTRGKSGTERLKAALVNSQGLSTVSKTTGCEAMFLYSSRYGNLKEMFLFRPYDKATIWEQTFVTRMAAKLGSDVLCWECMGLTPKYIDILQQQWMRDDMVTITNCFPDHEDLQGPAGIDIPQVIARFISPRSKAWTTEENMLAFLEKEALHKEADLTAVDWLDIATIPEDLLSRFPYQEHPANIALIAKMAEEMQVSRTMAIKEMADRVVPDIGVLQVFPYANVAGRNMRFVNGMSANERYGALANWQRLDYDQLDRQLEASFRLVTVINNRADRVPRSKVFAKLIANDFSASKHYVIGDNLDGFKMFVMEAWQDRLNRMFSNLASWDEFNQQCEALMRFLLIPSGQQLLQQLTKMTGHKFDLTNLDPASLEAQIGSGQLQIDPATRGQLFSLCNSYQASQTLLQPQGQTGTVSKHLVEQAKATFTQMFESKIRVVEDYYISGNSLNQLIASDLPNGIDTDILGLQNIKGPGLDFVYSWQQWQKVDELIKLTTRSGDDEIETHINELAAIPAYGVLDNAAVTEFLDEAQQSTNDIFEKVTLQLDQIQQNLKMSKSTTGQSSGKRTLLTPLVTVLEELIDIF